MTRNSLSVAEIAASSPSVIGPLPDPASGEGAAPDVPAVVEALLGVGSALWGLLVGLVLGLIVGFYELAKAVFKR